MVLKSLSCNTIGLCKHMSNGIEYDNETLIIELLDNSDKSIRMKINANTDDCIRIINGKDYFLLKDTGRGVSDSNIYDKVLRYYEIDSDNSIGMNKSGIGLKYVINNLMKHSNITILLSKTDDGDDYSMAILTKIGDEIKYDEDMVNITSKNSIRSLIDKLMDEDGFLILIIKDTLYYDEISFDDYKKILEIYIEKINNPITYEPYPELKETIEELFLDDTRLYKIYLNNELIEYNEFIDDNDINMFEININIKLSEDNHPQLFIENTDLKFIYTKRDFEVLEKTNTNTIIDEELQPLAKVTFYKEKNGSKIEPNGSFINYRMVNERNICKCPLSRVPGFQKNTMNYLKIDCNINNREYCRNYILKSIKTSTNHKYYDPTENLKRLNISLTKLIMNKDILEHHEWTLEKWCKNTKCISNTGNLYHLKQSEIDTIIDNDSDIELEGNDDSDIELEGNDDADDSDIEVEDNDIDSDSDSDSGENDTDISEECNTVECIDSTKRKDFNDSQITKYKQNNGNKCFLCGVKFSEYKCKTGYMEIYSHKDHWNGNSNDNRYINLRLLCLNCHERKTRLQKKNEFSEDIVNCEFTYHPWEAIEDS